MVITAGLLRVSIEFRLRELNQTDLGLKLTGWIQS